MADDRKARIEQYADRIAEWLARNRTEFEQNGINENSLSAAIGITEAAELEAAVDYLENHEEVVRWPLALTSPPQFLLKPGRIWPETRDKLLKAQSGSAS